jgi:hypothetical protein
MPYRLGDRPHRRDVDMAEAFGPGRCRPIVAQHTLTLDLSLRTVVRPNGRPKVRRVRKRAARLLRTIDPGGTIPVKNLRAPADRRSRPNAA